MNIINELNNEHSILTNKITKLQNDIRYSKLDKQAIELMKTQLFFMKEYAEILLFRIKHMRLYNG